MKTIHTSTLAFIMLVTLPNSQYNNLNGNGNSGIASHESKTAGDEKNMEDAGGADCTKPATPGVITGTPEACFGLATTYSVAPVTGATAYIWTVLGGAIQGTANGRSISVRFGHGGRSVSVKAVNSCGISGSRTLPVIVVNCF